MKTTSAILRDALCFVSASILGVTDADALSREDRSKPTAHETRFVRGWTVHFDRRLFERDADGGQSLDGLSLGDRAVAILTDRLGAVERALPAERVEDLRRVVLQVDRSHGDLERAQYHPSARWLAEHGYSTDLEKRVHIPRAGGFIDPRHQRTQPSMVLHELAHAYHHQVLGYDHEAIREAFRRYRESGKGASVRHFDGRVVEHYALSNEQEFFAEMTEAFAGRNDFYPFDRAELRRELPAVERLLRGIWGLADSP